MNEPEALREVVNTRTFRYPRELVYRAYTEAEHLAVWWGPNGFSSTFLEFDMNPGGNWRFVMHGPESDHHPNHIVVVEAVKPERLVLDHVSEPRFQITVTLEAIGSKTKATFRMLFETVEMCENLREFVSAANEQNYDRLGAELARMSAVD